MTLTIYSSSDVRIYSLESNQAPDRIKHCIVLDAVLESVVMFRVASRAVAEVVVPLGFAEAGFFPRRRIVSRRPGAENA